MSDRTTSISLTPNPTNIHKFFSLNSWQFAVLLGIAISGFYAFLNTYNSLASISNSLQACAVADPTLQQKLNTQFIFMIIISILAIVLGFVLAWVLHNRPSTHRLIVIAIIIIGALGLAYTVNQKLVATNNLGIKLGVPWASFVGFLLLGFLLNIFSRKPKQE